MRAGRPWRAGRGLAVALARQPVPCGHSVIRHTSSLRMAVLRPHRGRDPSARTHDPHDQSRTSGPPDSRPIRMRSDTRIAGLAPVVSRCRANAAGGRTAVRNGAGRGTAWRCMPGLEPRHRDCRADRHGHGTAVGRGCRDLPRPTLAAGQSRLFGVRRDRRAGGRSRASPVRCASPIRRAPIAGAPRGRHLAGGTGERRVVDATREACGAQCH